MAASLTQKVNEPRLRKLWLYSGQWVMRCLVLPMMPLCQSVLKDLITVGWNGSKGFSQQRQLQGQSITPRYNKWLKANKGEEIHLIDVEQLLYVRTEDKYLTLVTKDGERRQSYLLRQSLQQLLSELDAEQFWQIHRAIVVNVRFISKVRRTLTGMEAIVDGTVLPVSRAMQAKFKA